MTRSNAITEIRAIDRRCRGPLTPEAARVRDALIADGKLEEARDEDAAGRQGCGADFNNIIAAGPLDGTVHAYQCPTCGVEGEYRAPLYELDPELNPE